MKFDKYHCFKGDIIEDYTPIGYYDMPDLKPTNDIAPTLLLPFNEATKCKAPENYWLHFYIDDYRFERIWKNPKKYLPILKRFKGVITPDFSIYLKMPTSQQI